MCGLILAPEKDASKVQLALKAMGYRGPDGGGVGTVGQWAVGHVQLNIQASTGKQPFEDRDHLIAFVGEFFNHNGLGEEVILRRCLRKVDEFMKADGFWSIVEARPGMARVFTDHLGIKPLYYWRERNIVCSEIEPMFVMYGRPRLDQTYLSNCVKFGYDYSGRTPYEGIMQLPPGHVLEFDVANQPFLRPYWKWHLVPRAPTIRHAVEEAISNRLISDWPVALLLSGGLDSSIIYYSLKRMGREVRAFSVENGESEYLPEEVKLLQLPSVDTASAVAIMQAPLDLGSLVPQVQLAKAVNKAGFRVCLTGDGADELFGGYRRAKEYDSQHSDVFCELPYYHLPRLDRVMMRSSIELRSPYLAPQVVAEALALPYNCRTNKQTLKSAFRGLVPDRIIDRPKHPLKTPAVIDGGITYRANLAKEFKDHANRF